MIYVHILHNGFPLCGFSKAVPAEWPDNHKWIGLNVLAMSVPPDHIMCAGCSQVAARDFQYED
jgi:hypothetical protein